MGKQITDLDQAAVFKSGDLFLMRDSTSGFDKKIPYANVLKSLGNTAIKGFTATSAEDNEIDLIPSTGVSLDAYYDGMSISFVSPITSTGAVQVKIGSLVYKDLLQYATSETVIVQEDQYIEAVYIGNNATGKFYQTNISNTIGYTSEYTATGVVSGDESTTTLTLTSAIGTFKTTYYNSMILMFTCPVDSKGNVQVNVDGLGLKNLNEGADDVIANNLYAGEFITARYDGTQFIKHRSAVTNPPLPIPDPIIDEEALPDEYNITVTVGTFGQFASIREAINGLIRDFGDDGGNRKATVRLKTGFIIKEQLFFERCDYSWITLSSEDTTVQLDVSFLTRLYNGLYNFIRIDNGKTPNLNLKLVKTGNPIDSSLLTLIFADRGEITLTNNQFSGFALRNIIAIFNNSVINLNNSILAGNNQSTLAYLLVRESKVIIDSGSIVGGNTIGLDVGPASDILISNCTISDFIGNASYAIRITAANLITNSLTITNCDRSIYSTNSRISLNSSNLESPVNYTVKPFQSENDLSYTIASCTIKSTGGQNMTFVGSKNVTLTNCRVISPTDTNGQNMLAGTGAEVKIDGGDYRTVTNQTLNANIQASGVGAIVRLMNNPLGGTLASNGGVITNI